MPDPIRRHLGTLAANGTSHPIEGPAGSHTFTLTVEAASGAVSASVELQGSHSTSGGWVPFATMSAAGTTQASSSTSSTSDYTYWRYVLTGLSAGATATVRSSSESQLASEPSAIARPYPPAAPFALAVATGARVIFRTYQGARLYTAYAYVGSALVARQTSDTPSFTFPLPSGTAYTFRGTVTTAGGESAMSPASNSVTPTALPIAGMAGEFVGLYVADGQAYSDTNVMTSGWADSSGNGNTMVANGTAFTYRSNIVNGHAVARASTTCMKAPVPFARIGGSLTIYLAYQQDSGTNPQNYGVLMTQKTGTSSPAMNQFDTDNASAPTAPKGRLITQNGLITALAAASSTWVVRSFPYPGDGVYTNGVKEAVKLGIWTYQKGMERNARTRAYRAEYQPTGISFGNVPGTSNYFRGDFAAICIGYGAHSQATRWANEAALCAYLGLAAPAQQ